MSRLESTLDGLIAQMQSGKSVATTALTQPRHWQKSKKRRYDLEANELDCVRPDNDSSADEESDSDGNRKRKNRDLKYSEADPFYDPLEDNNDENFVDTTFNPHHSSECTLSCPQCFTIVCYDATQHARYHTQFRANEVINVRTDESKFTKPKIIQSGTQKNNNDNTNNDNNDETENNNNSVYHCVFCAICGAEIGARETVQNSDVLSSSEANAKISNDSKSTHNDTTNVEQKSESDSQSQKDDKEVISADIWTAIPDCVPTKRKDSSANNSDDSDDDDDDDEKPVTMEEIEEYLKEKSYIYHFYHVFPGNI